MRSAIEPGSEMKLRPRSAAPRFYLGDLFGSISATLVALPSAIAFGILVFAPLGAQFSAQGALAGMVGAVVIGIVASCFGGTPRLVSSPCAPGAAILASFVSTTMVQSSSLGLNANADAQATIPLLLALIAAGAGFLQILFGLLGGGKLIKYIPYPVVAGYLAGVGLIIFGSQCPKFFGLPAGVSWTAGVFDPKQWQWPALPVGVVAALIMFVTPRVTKKVPAPVLAVFGGTLAFHLLVLLEPTANQGTINSLLIGRVGAGASGDQNFIVAGAYSLWSELGRLKLSFFNQLIAPTLTLATLLSIDTLKTCVILDALTRSRHKSNRELIGQGIANLSSSLIGGLPGAGTMGATLINTSSGAVTRMSGVYLGFFSLIIILFLQDMIAMVPIAALAGVLMVVGLRMIDPHIAHLVRQRSTQGAFVVICIVAITALTWNLIGAAAVGLGISILLFVQDQIKRSVVRRRTRGNQMYSKKKRSPAELEILEQQGERTLILELQGALFFGTTDQLFSELEPDLNHCKYIILDLRRVYSVDFSAIHLLSQIESQVVEHGGNLIYTHLGPSGESGRNFLTQFKEAGLLQFFPHVKAFEALTEALEWIEDQWISRYLPSDRLATDLWGVSDIALFSTLSAEHCEVLAANMESRTYAPKEAIFQQGDHGDEIFFVRRGEIKIVLSFGGNNRWILAHLGRGDFFGDMAFLDHKERSAHAIAIVETEVYLLSRKKFDQLVKSHPDLGIAVLSSLATAVAHRLRVADTEISALQNY